MSSAEFGRLIHHLKEWRDKAQSDLGLLALEVQGLQAQIEVKQADARSKQALVEQLTAAISRLSESAPDVKPARKQAEK